MGTLPVACTGYAKWGHKEKSWGNREEASEQWRCSESWVGFQQLDKSRGWGVEKSLSNRWYIIDPGRALGVLGTAGWRHKEIAWGHPCEGFATCLLFCELSEWGEAHSGPWEPLWWGKNHQEPNGPTSVFIKHLQCVNFYSRPHWRTGEGRKKYRTLSYTSTHNTHNTNIYKTQFTLIYYTIFPPTSPNICTSETGREYNFKLPIPQYLQHLGCKKYFGRLAKS